MKILSFAPYQALKDYISSNAKFTYKISASFSAYFLFKFFLFYKGYINFDILNNVLLLALGFVSFRRSWQKRIYYITVCVLAIIVLYKDSYLSNMTLFNFNQASVLENLVNFEQLITDFINFKLIALLIVLFIACYFLFDILNYAPVLIIGIALIAYVNLNSMYVTPQEQTNVQVAVANSPDIPPQVGKVTPSNIQSYLDTFFEHEKSRIVTMPESLPVNYQPFDIVILNICSMATDDVVVSDLMTHSVFIKFDFAFDDFNSVSSYSTPASMRLLRANCGQQTEKQMYQERRAECELLTSLEGLGFNSQVYFDHDGVYGDYLKSLNELAGLDTHLYDLKKLKAAYQSFDGTPIYSDRQLFSQYVNARNLQDSQNVVTFMNVLSLHDGNRIVGQSRSEPYKPRLKVMLNDIEDFIDNLEKAKRDTLFIMIPEHGAAIRGDKMQISRLREIPTDTITKVPVMIKFISSDGNKESKVTHIKGFYSYICLSEIIKRSIENNVFSKTDSLCTPSDIFVDLPQTAFIGESTNAFFLNFKQKDFYKLKGDTFAPYVK